MKPILYIFLVLILGMSSQAQEVQKQTETKTDEQPVFTIVEQMPTYPGGEKELVEFIQGQIKYPADAKEKNISGTVYLSFVVDTIGALTKITILRGVSQDIDSEAVRVVASMPKWNPGRQNGKAVPVKFTLPLRFALLDPEKLMNSSISNEEKSKLAYEVGLKCFKENNFPEAIKYFTQSLKVPNEHETDALFARGCAYYNMNDSTNACNDWKVGYFKNDRRASAKLEEYCGCFYDHGRNVVYFENAAEARLIHDSLKQVFTIIEVMPHFPGGENELVKFIQKNIVYPLVSRDNHIVGTVFATFVIDVDGMIYDIKILRGVNSELNSETIWVDKNDAKVDPRNAKWNCSSRTI